MAEREENGSAEFLIITVSDIDILAVQDTATLRAIVEESRIVLNASREAQGKFTGLVID